MRPPLETEDEAIDVYDQGPVRQWLLECNRIEYVRLNQTKDPFAQIPHGRYINFISDFLAAEKVATREQAMRAWEMLKTLDVPKNYRSWVKSQATKPR